MCFTGYGGYKRMCGFCKTRVPDGMADTMESLKDDAKAVEKYAVEWGIATCKTLMANGHKGLHFYTLNVDKIVLPILEGLGLAASTESA